MQLDAEESTPASDMTYWFHSRIAIWNCLHTAVYFARYELFSSLEFWSSDIGQTDGQKAMHKSPPCICTDVLKKAFCFHIAGPGDLLGSTVGLMTNRWQLNFKLLCRNTVPEVRRICVVNCHMIVLKCFWASLNGPLWQHFIPQNAVGFRPEN